MSLSNYRWQHSFHELQFETELQLLQINTSMHMIAYNPIVTVAPKTIKKYFICSFFTSKLKN